MDRRQFFRNSALISGVALSSGVLRASSFLSGSLQPVEKYLAFIGAHILDDEGDDSLKSMAEDRSGSLRQVGYSQKGRPNGLDRQGATVVFRYGLSAGSLGCIDTCLLFFEKDKAGKWTYLATLTGFQLDALAHTIENPLPGGRVPGKGSYIPAVQAGKHNLPGRIRMREGAVEILTRIEENTHRMSVRILSDRTGEEDIAFDLSRGATNCFWA